MRRLYFNKLNDLFCTRARRFAPAHLPAAALSKLIVGVIVAALTSSLASAFTLDNTSDGSMQGWANHQVAFHLNRANCPSNIDSILATAMGVWNGIATSDLVLSLGYDSTDSYSTLNAGTATDAPVIICDSSFATDSVLGGNGIAGVAHVYSPSAGGNISYAYLLINVDSSSTGNIASADPTLVSIVLAHEIGHVLGLGHSADPNALMYYSATRKTKLALAQDDIDGMSYLYPRNELSNQMLGCGLVRGIQHSGPPGSGFTNTGSGFENNGAAILFMLLPLILAIWLRSRLHALTSA